MYREQRKRRPIENQFFTQFSIFWNALDSVGSKEFCSSKIGHHNAYARSVRGRGGIARHSPGVKQLTRRNCPLLNCESVLWGIEADGQRPRRGPCASKKRNQNLVHAAVKHDQKWTHRDLLCLSLDRRNWSRSWPRPKQTPDPIPPQCVASSRCIFSKQSNLGITNSRRLSVGGNVEWRRPL